MAVFEKHIILNGEILPETLPSLHHNNRAFCYGDALFETMHAFGTEIQFANDHFQRLFNGLQVLKMEFTDELLPQKILREITRLLNRDKLFGGVRIRLTVFRNTGGLFKPQTNSTSYLIETKALDFEHYELNQKGLSIDVFTELRKYYNAFSAFKTANSLVNVMAGIWAKEQNLDDCLITNEKGAIIESYHSNLFLIKGNNIFTPAIEQGCIDGVMRNNIIKIASDTGMRIEQKIKLNEEALVEADEIFLTNAIEGIRWVGAFKQRRYFNKTSKMLCFKLNEMAFGK